MQIYLSLYGYWLRLIMILINHGMWKIHSSPVPQWVSVETWALRDIRGSNSLTCMTQAHSVHFEVKAYRNRYQQSLNYSWCGYWDWRCRFGSNHIERRLYIGNTGHPIKTTNHIMEKWLGPFLVTPNGHHFNQNVNIWMNSSSHLMTFSVSHVTNQIHLRTVQSKDIANCKLKYSYGVSRNASVSESVICHIICKSNQKNVKLLKSRVQRPTSFALMSPGTSRTTHITVHQT